MAGDMEELAVTSSLGAMGPVIHGLDSLMASQERLPYGVDKGKLEELNKDLKETRVSLQQAGSKADKYWAMEVRDLSYDTLDYLDMVTYHGGTISSQIRYWMLTKTKWRRRRQRQRWLVDRDISYLKHRLEEANKRRESYSPASSSGDYNPASTKPKETYKAGVSTESEIIEEEDEQQQPPVRRQVNKQQAEIKDLDKKLISTLAFHTDQQLRVVAISGSAGVDKTDLATTLYHYYGGRFQCRAFLRVSRKPNTVRLLTSMLSQIKGPQPKGSGDAQKLIFHIKRHLQGKS